MKLWIVYAREIGGGGWVYYDIFSREDHALMMAGLFERSRHWIVKVVKIEI